MEESLLSRMEKRNYPDNPLSIMRKDRKEERRALTETEARMAKKLADKNLDLKMGLARMERYLTELQAICSHEKRTDPREPCPDCGEQSIMASVLDMIGEPGQLPPAPEPNDGVATFRPLSKLPPRAKS